MIKKLLVVSALLFSISAPVVISANAAAVNVFSAPCSKIPDSSVCQDAKAQGKNDNPLINIVSGIINILSYLTGIAAIIGIIANGLRFILANGNPESIAGARSGLLYSVVGVVVAVIAQGIVVFVLNNL